MIQTHLTSARSEGLGICVVEAVGASYASLRVTIPQKAIDHIDLRAGDELRVAVTEQDELAFFPKGVPFTDHIRLYAGNTAAVRTGRSLKAVILQDAREELNIDAGTNLSFAAKESVIYAIPVGSVS